MKRKEFFSLVLVFAMMVTLVLPAGSPAFAASDPGNYIFDISEGNITVSAGTNEDTLKVTYGPEPQQAVDNIPAAVYGITITGSTTTNHVVVSSNVTADITLSNVDIEESVDSVCPFVLAYGQFGLYTTVDLTLVGDNTLVSHNYTAGLQVGWRQNLTIDGSGTLNVTGGQYAAGIGDSDELSSGIINIKGGTVIATGGADGGPGIGGGNCASCGTTTISGGTVRAQGTGGGAGIGGTGGTVNISAGSVTATGGSGGGAGIGGYSGAAGGTINISGGTITATGGGSFFGGAGIGGGGGFSNPGAGGTINISNGTITATGNGGGAGVGGGGNTGAPGTITINAAATVKAASRGSTTRPAFDAAGGSLAEGSTAKILMANFAASKAADTNTDIYIKSPSSLYASFAPENIYQSIAFTVPANNTYQLKTADILQQQNSGPSTNFIVTSDGINLFSGVTDLATSPLTSFTPVTLTQTGDVASNNVQYGTAADVIAALPTTIAVTLENSSVVNVPVTWTDTDHYNAGAAAAYTFTAAWGAMPAGANNDNSLAAPAVEVTVAAGAAATSPLKSFSPVPFTQTGDVAHHNVQYGSADAVIAALPAQIVVTLENDSHVFVPVTWTDTDHYNAGIAACYTFTAAWGAMPEGANNNNNLATPTVEVLVKPVPYWTDAGYYDTTLYNELTAPAFAATTVSISTPQQLAAVAKAQDVNGVDFTGVTIELANDIDLSGCLWDPIGLANGDTLHGTADGNTHEFQGNFNGNNHVVSNMNNMGSYVGAGLFGTVGDPAASEPFTLSNVTVNGTINVNNTVYVGGIAAYGFRMYFKNCVNNTEITCTNGDNAAAGGIVGVGASVILDGCINEAGISLTSLQPITGGIAGITNRGSIYNCANAASVTGSAPLSQDAMAGGISGRSLMGTVYNCYNTGAVTATGSSSTAGGICGSNSYFSGNDMKNNKVLIQNCYNAGSVSAANAGGIAGMLSDVETNGCCYLNGTAACTYYDGGSNPVSIDGSGVSGAQMQAVGFCQTLNAWVTAHPVSSGNVESFFHLPGVNFSGWVRQAGVNNGYPVFGDASQNEDSAACEVTNWISPSAPTVNGLLVTKTVDNATTALTVDVTVSAGASWKLYSDASCTNEIADKVMSLGEGNNTVYLKVTAQDNLTSKMYTLTITRQAHAHNGGGNNGDNGDSNPGDGNTSIAASSGVDIIVNKDIVNAGTASNSTKGGKAVTTITVDQQKLEQKLATEGSNALVIIPINTAADKLIGQLNGQMVKDMEDKQATLEVKTGSAAYTLPASEINIGAVSDQLGTDVTLANVTVQIAISSPSDQTVTVVKSAAKGSGFSLVVPAVDFSVSCTYNGKTVDVSTFNSYVERTVAVPEGVDPAKITTGVVVNPDGTVRHVPTKVTIIDGKYYAVINSLTNSTYTVIWHPVEFTDVTTSWAKNSINDMGSRMVVSGVGNNNYAPDRNITRAEFAAIIVRALGLPPGTGKNSFSDVEASKWYCGSIETASAYGIIKGYNTTTFGPDDTITREQAMSMTARAMEITGLKSEIKDSEISPLIANYSDGTAASDYAKTSIAACLKTGIITGRSSNTIAPKNYITRAEVAVVVQRLLRKSNLI